MKKLLAFILIGTLCISFAGCQSGGTGESSSSESTSSSTTPATRPSTTPKPTTQSSSTNSKPNANQGFVYNPTADAEWRTHPEDFKLVAFTFDDAPSYKETGSNMGTRIVDLFNKYEGCATFFVNGYRVMDDKGEMQNGTKMLEYALSHGFELGNHTNNHKRLTELSKVEIKNEIESVNDILRILLKYETKFVRPGYLAANQDVYDVCTELNMHLIHEGTVSMQDSSSKPEYNEDYIYNTAMSNIKDGDIILMHDWPGKTDRALQRIIPELYEQGYRFVTLTELFEYKGIDVDTLPTDKWIHGVENGQIR